MVPRRSHRSGSGAGSAPGNHCRIVVVSSTVDALVVSAGGYLYDRVREGWDVAVALSVAGDARPLNILGIRTHEAVDEPASVIAGLTPGTPLAVGADLLTENVTARQALARLAARGYGTVTVWGRPSHAEIEQGLEPVPHAPSTAARAYKASALRAAQVEGVAEAVESLYRVRGGSFRRLYAV